MSEWFDPKIIFGIIGAVLGVISILWNVYSSRNNGKKIRGMRLWDEYRETAVDPLRSSLKDLRKPAEKLFLWSVRHLPDFDERKRFFSDLAMILNTVEMESERADHHPMSAKENWSKLTETKNQQIYSLIDARNLNGENPENLPEGLDELRDLLNSYDRIFEMRMREKWKETTGIYPD